MTEQWKKPHEWFGQFWAKFWIFWLRFQEKNSGVGLKKWWYWKKNHIFEDCFLKFSPSPQSYIK